MPASKSVQSGDIFFVIPRDDGTAFEAHVQVNDEDVDSLFSRIDVALAKIEQRGYKPRPEKKPSTFVKVEPKKYAPQPVAEDPMVAAANSLGVGKACPVCDTQMDYVATKRDGSPLPFGPFWACPKCQKKVNAKQREKTNEIPF